MRTLPPGKSRSLKFSFFLSLPLWGCGGPQSMFESAAPPEQQVIHYWWILLGVSLFVFVILMGALAFALIRNRNKDDLAKRDRFLTKGIGWASVATVVLLFASIVSLYQLPEPKIDRGPPALTVQVTGKLWWWKVKYYSEKGQFLFETANEIYLPAGKRVRFELLSEDVIHSLWIPKVSGKIDMIPGHTNYLWVEVEKPGKYRAQCAEYCGLQHAKMAFWVHAVSQDQFKDWVQMQRAPAKPPQDPLSQEGKRVYVEAGCIRCHSIRKDLTLLNPELAGPDLTHLASRGTLGAGSVPNNRGFLAAWVADSQGIKPGNLMPAFPLKSEKFNALIHYLESLK